MESRTLRIAGTCVNNDHMFEATVVIDRMTGLICGIEAFNTNADIVIERGAWIFSGFIDNHVHNREDVTGEDSYKENFHTGGEAAINGGVVHVAEMGNNPKPPVDDASYIEKRMLTSECPIPVTLYAMIGPNTNLLTFHVPYKFCLARTTGKNDIIFFPHPDTIEETAQRYRGVHVSLHSEDHGILESCKGAPTHELRRPPEAEVVAVDHGIHLIEKYFGKGKICHVSVIVGVDKIVAAKKRGVQVTCEVTPAHLYFDQSMITPENHMWMRINPPLRSVGDRYYCIEALRSGEIDMIASDHAPHTEYDKLKGASGFPQLDTLGPFTTWLVKEHRFTAMDIARVCSFAPAQFLNQFLSRDRFGNGYGRIEVGYMGSLTVIDPNKPITVTKAMLKTKCRWSPFEGVTFPGSVLYTIVKGKVLKAPELA